jgi:hypothetical protein
MANTAKKTAKTSKTASKTAQKIVNIKTTTKERKAKTEKPDLKTLNKVLFTKVIFNTEKLAENAKTGLSYWKAIGDNLIEIRKNWIAAGGDIKARGEASFATYRETSSIGFMSKQDVSDAILIAKNWAVVTKMDDTESLDAMGVSKCKKAIKEAQKKTPKQGPATSATSKKTKSVSAQSIVDNALATAAKHGIKVSDLLITLKTTLENQAKK